MITRLLTALLLAITAALAQTPDQVLVVVNTRSDISRQIGDYYMQKRGIPRANLCTITTAPVETVTRPVYASEVEKPIGAFLSSHSLAEKILYIVLTSGVPLRVSGGGDQLKTDSASVDSELTLLYSRLHSINVPLAGPLTNPFFGKRNTPFRHPAFPMFLVTRLDGYTLDDVKGLIDRALVARNTGKFVIDLKAREANEGNQWLRSAALLLPENRLVLDDSATVLTGIKDVIAYASWGSNDTDRKRRFLHFTWLPGAIATEFVSTDARTFRKPPDAWEIGTWSDRKSWYEGAPQTLTADYIHEGASGASGQVDEPFLAFCPRPDFILPAYYTGRNLAESFYVGIPALSWMNVVIGDPLMRLK